MKALRNELKTVIKTLKALTAKAERMSKRLEVLEKAQAAGKAKTKAKPKRKTVKKPVARKKAVRKSTKEPASSVVLKLINRSKKGVDTATLKSKTGFKENNIRVIIYRLKKQGKIKSVRKGFYVKA